MEIPGEQHLETAYQALQAYDLQPVLVNFIQHSENLTFCAETPTGSYLLRLHTPISASFGTYGADSQMVKSEMLWLEALRKKNLPVPQPIKTRLGKYVTHVKGINATLLAWQEGELLTREMESEATAAQIGSLVGQLHAHSSRWKVPEGFSRPLRNINYLYTALAALKPAVEDGRIAYQDYKVLETSTDLLALEASRLRKGRRTAGLLHGDLHRGNFLLHAGQIRIIDFSMCAFGHFAFDLGTCLSNVRTAFHPIFLEAYTRFFSLPLGHERLIEGYFLGSWIMTFALWIADPQSQEVLIQRVPYIAREYASRFNRDERFWFS
jgi:Ser/Thr protein kinase RdoA (MazF antagonist)